MTALTAPQPLLLAGDALESFRNFEMRMYSEYQHMQKAFDFTVIEGNQPIDHVQITLRRAIMRLLLEMSEPDITPRQLDMMVQHFNKGRPGEYRIFCAHHSFLPVPTKKLKPGDVVPRSADILQTLIELNVDLLCCGHIHRSHVWDLSDGRHRLLCCNAGSLLDTTGKKDNGFLEIEIEIEIEDDLRIGKRTL